MILDATLLRYVREGAVAVVAKQLVGAEIREQQIDPAVVVDVGRRHTQAVLISADTTRVGDVRELELTRAVGVHTQVISIETPLGSGRLVCSQYSTLHQVNVKIAVVVVIEQPDTRRKNFGIVEPSRRAMHVYEVEPRLNSSLAEPLIECSRCSWCPGCATRDQNKGRQDCSLH